MLNLEKLDDRISKIAQLKELLADPEIARLAREVLASGNAASQPLPDLLDVTLGRPDSIIRNAFNAVSTFDVRFTAEDLKEKMLKLGYKFKADNPLIGVRRVLWKLMNDKIVKRVEVGSGRAPHVYQRIHK